MSNGVGPVPPHSCHVAEDAKAVVGTADDFGLGQSKGAPVEVQPKGGSKHGGTRQLGPAEAKDGERQEKNQHLPRRCP